MYTRIQVDTEQTLARAAEAINSFAKSHSGPLALDAEGIDLSRIGALTVLMIKPIDLTHSADVHPAYIIDVLHLGAHRVFALLRQVLEDHTVQKIMFDCRADADALHHQFQVRLENVLDLQVYDQATRGYRPSRGPVKYVPSMSIVAPEHISRSVILELRGDKAPPHKEDMYFWQQRPLPTAGWQYAAADVHTIDLMFRSMESKQVSSYSKQRIQYHSTRRLNQYRDYPVPIVFSARFKALILTEVPLMQA